VQKPSRSKVNHPPSNGDGALITHRRDPFSREWVPLPAVARRLGFDWRTLRKHLAGEAFVRVLGERWYVRYAEFVEWWERQRPTKSASR
jgi:hypothetical protein